jgi:hypothetical protein
MAPIRHAAALLIVALAGCATYVQDLDRAQRHYQANEFAKALAVLRLLGEDEEALGEADRVRFAYLRGMTDYRLASLTSAANRTQSASFRSCARDWLRLAVSGMKTYPQALSANEQARAMQALAAVAGEPDAGRCLDGRDPSL